MIFVLFVVPENGHHAFRFEALADEVSIQAPEFGVIRDVVPAAQTLGKRCLEERLGVNRSEDFVHRALCGSARDAGLLDVSADPELATASHRRLCTRDCLCYARIVDGAFAAKRLDGRIDRVGVVAFPCETLPHLRFRQLASGEHFEGVEISLASRQIS